VHATANAGDFDGHWVSRTALHFEYALSSESFDIRVTATNVGDEILPMGIGSHPYFRLPSGDRTQARVHVPARMRAVVGDYDTVLPTGEIVPVAGTPYDLSAPDGRALDTLYLDDCFLDLTRQPDGSVVSSIVDPAAHYGIRVIGRSAHIGAVQVYAPLERAYVALEPQFNLADPFGAEWPRAVDTGMVMLTPGASVDYRVSLELFTV
jgi:galactose mutarotase-like enzyme